MAYESGKADSAQSILSWVAEKGADKGYASSARLRLSAVLMESKSYEKALQLLSTGVAEEYVALVADRTGDIYTLQGNPAEAKKQYQKAFAALDERVRRVPRG